MSNSSTAKLSFGVAFDEGFEFPWSGNDIKDWWLQVTGYVQPPELKSISSIYDAQKQWLKLNQLPIKLIAKGYHDDSSYIIATKTKTVEWDETLEVNIDLFDNVDEQSKTIVEFLNKYNIEYEGSPKWLLSSFYS